MSRRRHKQLSSLSIFLRALGITFFILITIFTIFGCVKITQNADETIEVGTDFQYATIKWLFYDVSDKALIMNNNVDTSKIGNYKISYLFGFRILNQTIHVVDTQSPVIELKGESVVYTENIEKYKEPGYEASDNYDGDLTWKVKKVCIPDKSEFGKYVFIYSVSDSSGNMTEIERIVYIVD